MVFLGSLAPPILVSTWGFLLGLMGVALGIFDFIVEKVQAKLSRWKAKLLSLAGRVVLI